MVVGFAWYKEEQWQRLREVCPDRDKLEERYEDWRRTATQAFLNYSNFAWLGESSRVDLG